MKSIAVLCCCLWTGFATAQSTYHTPPTWTIDLMKEQHQYAMLSPLVMDDGRRVTTADEWNAVRRPQLLQQWTKILGKLEMELGGDKSIWVYRRRGETLIGWEGNRVVFVRQYPH